MKKAMLICSLFLCIFLPFTLSACGDTEQAPSPSSPAAEEEPVDTPQDTPEAGVDSKEEPEPEKPKDKFTYFDMELDEHLFVELDKQQIIAAYGSPVSAETIEDPLFGNYEVLSYNFGKIDIQDTAIRAKISSMSINGPRKSHVGNTVEEILALFRNENPDAVLSENEYDGSKYMLLYGKYGGAEEFGVVLYDENNKVKEIRYASGIYALVYGVSGGRVDSIEMFVSLV